MKYIVCGSLLSVLLVTGCGQSSNEQAPSESVADEVQSEAHDEAMTSGEPVTLHARFEFMDASASTAIDSHRQLKASFYMQTDVIRDGSGADASFSLDTEDTRVQGALFASGSLSMKENDISSSETYNMQNVLGAMTTNPEGKFVIQLPEASMVGEGLSVGVELEVPVSGVKKAIISSQGQTIESQVTHARSMFCATRTEDSDLCTLKFTIDAVPTKAQDPAYERLFESARAAYPYQGKQSPDGGLIMYSGLLPVYGAFTRYHNGHFVTELNQHYKINLDGTDISQHIHLVVWSTNRGDSWQPEGLPPLQTHESQH